MTDKISPEEAKKLLEFYFSWTERLGVTAVIASLGFLVICGLLIYVIGKLVESYKGQINDLRLQRDKLQDSMAKKVSSGRNLDNLEE
jgi:hypothetical protein